MLYYLTAIGLIAHTLFWGAGLALFWSPRAWRPCWWALAPALGQALQSAVVWAGAHSALAGTNVYAWWSELLPLALLGAALLRESGAVRRMFRSVLAAGGVVILMLTAGWLLVSPLRMASRDMTTVSLGSCDQADYAAGARVFQEFSRQDRTGFLGLPEVTKVRSADYFFDFWLRLNHFTPSALLAHNASIFGYRHYQLVGVSAVVLLVLNLPLVLLFARVTLKLRGIFLLGVVLLYALSPLQTYAAYNGALAQIYATQGIALLTLTLVAAGRAFAARRSGLVYWPLLVAAFWLLAGSYNFILLVCLTPAGAWLLAQAWTLRSGRIFARVVPLTLSALAACALFSWGRFNGLAERFSLFAEYNFGWVVPLTTPEGWTGLLRDRELHALPFFWRTSLSGLVVTGWLVGVIHWWRRERSTAWLAIALVVPVLAGWGWLAWESQTRANASYDGYKLLAVFLPGIVVAICGWLGGGIVQSRRGQRLAGAILLLLLAANLGIMQEFRARMQAPPLRVDRPLRDLERLELDPEIHSLNMLVDDYWGRIWANAFLLRLPQYFTIHTYEGRLNTPLKGEWNLSDSLLHSVPLSPEDYRALNLRFHLERAAAPGLVQVRFADGWYGEEKDGPKRWRWSGGSGRISLVNPGDVPLRIQLRLLVRSFHPQDLTVRLDGHVVATQSLNGSSQMVMFKSLLLPPGAAILTLAGDATSPGGKDNRLLAFALYGLELRALALEP